MDRLSQELVGREVASKKNPVLSFRINGDLELVCQRPEVRERINSLLAAESETAMCSVCL